ncbi:MAG: PEP-CTERM sorting domain-containing protein [Chthoniobacterales bacterium]
MNSFRLGRWIALCAILSLVIPSIMRAQVTFSASGANAAAIQATVDAFRSSLGTLNANVAGSFGSGRREINWDGVPSAFAAPNLLAANFFNVNSPRGVVFSTPGTGFAVSGATTDAGAGQPAAANFGNIDPSYTATFAPFSAQRLFTAIGSNVVDVTFFVAGSATPALTTGFGAVFSDVDLANTTTIQLFDASNVSLGTFFVPNVAGASQTFSFLGIQFPSAIVSRVRITSGNIAPAAGATDQNGAARDVVVMDDFIYGEPIPEPATYVLLATGVMALAAFARKGRA